MGFLSKLMGMLGMGGGSTEGSDMGDMSDTTVQGETPTETPQEMPPMDDSGETPAA